MIRQFQVILLFFALSILLLPACTTTKQTHTARTGREQMLVSNAIDQSLSKTDFSAFSGAKVFVEEKYLDCVDKGYLISSIRHRLSMNGGKVVGKPDDADIVLEVRSGAVGTDLQDTFVGTPEIVLPGMLTLPEVRFLTRNSQTAMAKIGLAAYDAKTMELLGAGGVASSKSDDNNLFVMGIGPWQSGSVKEEIRTTVGHHENEPWQEVPAQVAFSEGGRGSGRERSGVRLTSGRRGEDRDSE